MCGFNIERRQEAEKRMEEDGVGGKDVIRSEGDLKKGVAKVWGLGGRIYMKATS